jgi:hypothetical protein
MARPTIADVERLARGLAAARRGTGSRSVPHRLNAEEHRAYELAKQRGFAVVKGSGQRRERKGSPLLNTLRQRSDALDRCLVWCQQGRSSEDDDICCIDFSPRRLEAAAELQRLRERALRVALRVEGARLVEDSAVLFLARPEEMNWPIWRVPVQVTRFASPHAEPQVTKLIAGRLASEFGLCEADSLAL